MKKKTYAVLVLAGMTAMMAAGCGAGNQVKLDPDHPVSLTVWHYYNGAQQSTFEALVEEFNATVGREKGIYVEEYSYGSVSDLEEGINSALNGEVGADALPDIFSSYADTADLAQKEGKLVDLTTYFSDEELSEYVDSYIEEGYFNDDGALYLLPVAKSTEIMMINRTDWEPFAEATGASLDELETMDGVVDVAERYYEWTDAQTPDIPDDGKAFYGRDSMSNYFIIGMRQMGTEIFEVKDGEVTLHTDKELIRRLWDSYYVPSIKGYFGAYGKFRSDDVKTGDILAYTGSTSSVFYFPDTVEKDDESYDIDFIVRDAPIMSGGEHVMVQQGAGMTVTKSDEQHEYAACKFLKWFTSKEQNLRFVCESAYLPVLKDVNSMRAVEQVAQENGIEMNAKTLECLKTIMDGFEETQFYTTKNFTNKYQARSVLDHNLSDRLSEDLAAVDEAVAGGMSRDEAIAPYLTDEAFETWYQTFCDALQQSLE